MRIILFIFLLHSFLFSNEAIKMQRFYFEDVGNKVVITDIINASKNIQWKELNKKNDQFAHSKNQFWVKIVVNANKIKNINTVVELQNFYRGDISLFDNNGELLNEYSYDKPFDSFAYFYPKITLPLFLEKKENVYYALVNSKYKINLTMKLWDEKEFQIYSLKTMVFYGAFFAALIVLAIYNTVFYLISKEKIFFSYILYSYVIIVAMLFLTGFGFMSLWSDYPEINKISGVGFYFLMLIFGLNFTKDFLNTKENTPKIDKLIKSVMILGLVMFLLKWFLSPESTLKMLAILNILTFSTMLFTAIYYTFTEKNNIIKLVFLGWLFLVSGMILGSLTYLGVIELNIITSRAMEIGVFLEVLFFSFAIAAKYKDKQIALLNAKQELLEINSNLETLVESKTLSLKEINEKLNDELVFNAQLMKELSHRVKNNLQMILSFLSLQIKHSDNQEANKLIIEGINRIKAIFIIYELLLGNNNFEKISMEPYIKKLTTHLNKINSRIDIKINLYIDNLLFNSDKATIIGLIINELCVNSYKYAFEEVTNPTIDISLKFDFEKNIHKLEVSDNGKGDLSLEKSDSLGLKIVDALCNKLKADYTVSSEQGIKYIIYFK